MLCSSRPGARLVIILAAIGFLPGDAAAQLASLPAYFRPVHDPYPVWSVYADYGIGFSDISDFQMVAGRVTPEGEKLRGEPGVGGLIPDDGDVELAVAGNAAYNLRGPLILVTVVGLLGVGYFELGDDAKGKLKRFDIPFGVAVGLTGKLPLDFISNVEA